MNKICVWSLLFFCGLVCAKTPRLYHCQQLDGRVVIQDRRCQITDLTESKPQKTSRQNKMSQSSPVTEMAPPKNFTKPAKNSSNAEKKNRSPYFKFGWDRFIPVNWQLRKEQLGLFHQIMLSKNQFKGAEDFDVGLKLKVYPKTNLSYQKGAFSVALNLYHQIRKQYSNHLIDSQFKSHQRFKVFNIGYQLPHQVLALTEFYIDEQNNDLFVVTIQSPQSSWYLHQQLAEELISRL